MSAEFTYYSSGIEIEEPKLLTALINMTITNTGDEAGTELGFYLRTPSSAGSFDYPATDAPVTNYFDLIKQGDLGYGIVLHQGVNTYTFDSTNGSSALNKIPLVIGSGTSGNIIPVGDSINITLSVSFDPTFDSKTLYIDFVIE